LRIKEQDTRLTLQEHDDDDDDDDDDEMVFHFEFIISLGGAIMITRTGHQKS